MKIYDLISKDQITDIVNLDINSELTLEERADVKRLVFRTQDLMTDNQAVLVTEEDQSDGIPFVKVKDRRLALAHAYKSYYMNNTQSFKQVIGVTGTNGKTTTAKLIAKALELSGARVGFIGTGEISIGSEELQDRYYSYTTPPPEILYPALGKMLGRGCEYLVAEVSSHSIKQKRIAPLKFDIALFTNLSREHGDYHKSFSDYYEQKKSFTASAGHGIYNLDDSYSRLAYLENDREKSSVGIIRRGSSYATDIEQLGLSGTRFTYAEGGLYKRLLSPLAGAYNVYNTLMAIRALRAIKMDTNQIFSALERIKSIGGRLERIIPGKDVFIDYAHTPLAFENILKTLNSGKRVGQKLICLFGCGGDRDKDKRHMMGCIAEKYCDFTVVTSDNCRSESFEQIASDILSKIKARDKVIVIPDRKEAIIYALEKWGNEHIIALLGKGREGYMIEGERYLPFSEKEIVKKYFSGGKAD